MTSAEIVRYSNSPKTDIRKMDDILNMRYSDMTDEELEALVAYKAACKFESDTAAFEREAAKAALDETVNVLREKSEADSARMEELVEQSRIRLEASI